MSFLSFFISVSLLVLSSALEYQTSQVSKTFVKSKFEMDLLIDSTTNKVQVTITGPSTVYYSVGFGNTLMSDTYCIAVLGTGEVEERYLIGTTEGNLLDSTFSVDSNVVSGSTRTVVLSRDLDYELPSDYHYEFGVQDKSLDTIYAYGTTSYLSDHGENRRGSNQLTMTRIASLKTKKNSASTSNHLTLVHFNNKAVTLLFIGIVVILVASTVILFRRTRKHNKLSSSLNSAAHVSYNTNSSPANNTKQTAPVVLVRNNKNNDTKTDEEYEEIADDNDRLVVV